MTDLYGVIGHPIAHSKSPVIHRLFAEQTAQDLRYEAFDIAPDELAAHIHALVADGLRGFNVTVPHKESVAALVDVTAPRAAEAGAVNTVTVADDGQLHGDNTDGVGLLRDLTENLGLELAGRSVLVLGAGGATRGIVPALLGAAPARLRIANRTPERARALVERLGGAGPLSACTFDELGGQPADIIINATSAGLHGEAPPFPPSIVGRDSACYDLSYAMADTPFVRWARSAGAARVCQGWGMLVEQAAEACLIWRGVRPDTAPVRQRLPGADRRTRPAPAGT